MASYHTLQTPNAQQPRRQPLLTLDIPLQPQVPFRLASVCSKLLSAQRTTQAGPAPAGSPAAWSTTYVAHVILSHVVHRQTDQVN